MSWCVVYTIDYLFMVTVKSVIYPLSLHDALPIFLVTGEETKRLRRQQTRAMKEGANFGQGRADAARALIDDAAAQTADRKSTRLNSSHANISYAVFCLKKKIKEN